MNSNLGNKIKLEKKRLEEIYSLIFPGERVCVILEIVPLRELTEAVELDIGESSSLIPFGSKHIHWLDLNQNANLVPSRLIHVKKTLDSDGQSASVFEWGFRNKIKNFIRKYLILKSPLIYEIIKNFLLKRKEGVLLNFNRISNLNNPKNQKPEKTNVKSMLFFLHWLDVGGAEQFAVSACEIAHQQGKAIYVIAERSSRPFYEKQIEKIACIYELERQVPSCYRAKFVLGLVEEKKIELIHNHHSIFFYESLPMLRRLNSKIVVVDSLHIDEKNRYQGGFPRISCVWSNYIDWHHVISRRLYSYLVTRGVNSSRVLYGHLAKKIVSNSEFSIVDSLKKKKITLAFVGRMSVQKRPMLACALLAWAVKYAEGLGFAITVQVVGDGFYLPYFKKYIQNEGLNSRFNFYEANASVHDVLIKSDLLLLTSENEGITLVGYEAINAGALVVSTDVGAQKELVPSALLLRDAPLQAMSDWKVLFKNLIKNNGYLSDAILELRGCADSIGASIGAEEVLNKIYGGGL